MDALNEIKKIRQKSNLNTPQPKTEKTLYSHGHLRHLRNIYQLKQETTIETQSHFGTFNTIIIPKIQFSKDIYKIDASTVITYSWTNMGSHKISGHLFEACDLLLTNYKEYKPETTFLLIPETSEQIISNIIKCIKDKYTPEAYKIIWDHLVFAKPLEIKTTNIIFVDGILAPVRIIKNPDASSKTKIELNLCVYPDSPELLKFSTGNEFQMVFSKLVSKYLIESGCTLVVNYDKRIYPEFPLLKTIMNSFNGAATIKLNDKTGGLNAFNKDITQDTNEANIRLIVNDSYLKPINMELYRISKQNRNRDSHETKTSRTNKTLVMYVTGDCRSIGNLCYTNSFPLNVSKEIIINEIIDIIVKDNITQLAVLGINLDLKTVSTKYQNKVIQHNHDYTFIEDLHKEIHTRRLKVDLKFVLEIELPYEQLHQAYAYYYTPTVMNWDCNPRLLQEFLLLNKKVYVSKGCYPLIPPLAIHSNDKNFIKL